MYDLPTPAQLLEDMPAKEMWKKQVREQIHNHWLKMFQEKAKCKKTLCYLKIDACSVGNMDPRVRPSYGDQGNASSENAGPDVSPKYQSHLKQQDHSMSLLQES
jgi:hypothetical protein